MADPTINRRVAELEVANYSLTERLDNAERKLRQLGYRRCDMIASNCKGYHSDGVSRQIPNRQA